MNFSLKNIKARKQNILKCLKKNNATQNSISSKKNPLGLKWKKQTDILG